MASSSSSAERRTRIKSRAAQKRADKENKRIKFKKIASHELNRRLKTGELVPVRVLTSAEGNDKDVGSGPPSAGMPFVVLVPILDVYESGSPVLGTLGNPPAGDGDGSPPPRSSESTRQKPAEMSGSTSSSASTSKSSLKRTYGKRDREKAADEEADEDTGSVYEAAEQGDGSDDVLEYRPISSPPREGPASVSELKQIRKAKRRGQQLRDIGFSSKDDGGGTGTKAKRVTRSSDKARQPANKKPKPSPESPTQKSGGDASNLSSMRSRRRSSLVGPRKTSDWHPTVVDDSLRRPSPTSSAGLPELTVHFPTSDARLSTNSATSPLTSGSNAPVPPLAGAMFVPYQQFRTHNGASGQLSHVAPVPPRSESSVSSIPPEVKTLLDQHMPCAFLPTPTSAEPREYPHTHEFKPPPPAPKALRQLAQLSATHSYAGVVGSSARAGPLVSHRRSSSSPACVIGD